MSGFNMRGGGAFSSSIPGLSSATASATAGLGAPPPPSSSVSSSNQHAAAIESLSLTAQSVGLSIEQLAVALSTSNNLKALTDDVGSNSDSQKQLALSLYSTELLALYRRCMLLAGYDSNSIEEHLPQFAYKCWQEEGRRLQDLMGAQMSLQAPIVANLQQEAALKEAQAQALALEQKNLQSRLQRSSNLWHTLGR